MIFKHAAKPEHIRFGFVALVFCALMYPASRAILGAAASRAQNGGSAASHSDRASIQSSAELVRVEASVIDRHGQFVGNLRQKDFHISDLGQETPIDFFAPVETSTMILVLVETSPAVYLIHNEHLLAASTLLDGLSADDQVALATYNQAIQMALPFTSNKPLLAGAIGNLEYNLGMGDLNFYNAVASALDFLKPLPGKRVLVLLSTGLDSSPAGNWEALESKLRASDVPIFSVGLGGWLRGGQGKSKRNAKESAAPKADTDANVPNVLQPQLPGLNFDRAAQVLREISELTGGKAYFPVSAKDFAAAYREIATIVRHEYLLGFEPAVRDGHFHAIQVQIANTDGVHGPQTAQNGDRVFARQGYLAPNQ